MSARTTSYTPPCAPACLRALCAALAASLLLVSTASPVLAQEGDAELMQEYVDRASKAFQQGEYADAGALFMRAYEVKSEPVLLKNAMVAYYSDGDCASAVDKGQMYLDAQKKQGTLDATDAEKRQIDLDKKDAKKVISKCRLRTADIALNQNDLAAAQRAIDGIEAYVVEEDEVKLLVEIKGRVKEMEDSIAAQKRDPVVTPPPETSKPQDRSVSNQAIAGWILVGSGAAVLGGTGYRNFKVNNEKKNFEADYGDRIALDRTREYEPEDCKNLKVNGNDSRPDSIENQQECRDVLNRTQNANLVHTIGYSVGGALLLTGVTLLVFDNRAKESAVLDSLVVSPDVGAGSAGGSVFFRF